MDLSSAIEEYFRGEKQTGMGAAVLGVVLLIGASWIWRTQKGTFGTWLMVAFAILGLVLTVVGAGLALKTGGQVAELTTKLGEDHSSAVTAELARMTKVNANWPRLKMAWGVLGIGGVGLLLVMHKEWATALGLILMFTATAGFFVDIFAERRAEPYTEALEAASRTPAPPP